uniref:M90 family metallopeptidase n=1 Tax=Flavobacterium sp. TaxID=239 RepID=UPI00404A4EEA
MTLTLATFFLIIIGFIGFKMKLKKESAWKFPTETFPANWRIMIQSNIPFYNALSDDEKKTFEYKIQEFLLNCKITGVKTQVTITDKLLVASSAIIPIFGFKNWKYLNLQEVLIYPTMFNHDFETEGSDRRILGMVGNGFMNGVMILSKEALVLGFQNESDKKNTAIHEFVHLIDKTDGPIDGIPSSLMEKQYAIPWIDLMNKKIDEIYEGESDINPYGGTNQAEFFSVVSEYFFERPKLLKRKHPDLYNHLERIFNQDMSARNLTKAIGNTERNSICPCNSGKKFKKCCGKL